MPERNFRNRILSSVAPADFELLSGHLQAVELGIRLKIETPNKAISHVYFVEDGIVSVVATGPQRQTIEVGVIGYEGMTGLPVILGQDRSPLDVYVQVAGHGYRLPVTVLRQAMAQSSSLSQLLLRHVQVFHIQTSFSALSNGRALLEQRLARWLLMAQDRLLSNDLRLTHEFLAMMLAVRRPGVTVALSVLAEHGLVKVKRGSITVLDRAGLERIADKYYGTPEAELNRLLPPPRC